MTKHGFALALAAALLAMIVGPLGAGTPAMAAQVLGTSGAPIRVEINKGRLIRLDKPASTVFIADSTIADVQVKTPRLIYLFAKKAGETTLYAVDGKDRVLLNRSVHVTHNLSQLSGAIRGVAGVSGVRLRSVDGSIVLSGAVTSAAKAEDVRRLAASYVGDKQVVNKIAVKGSQQINLRVRIAEISRSTVKQLGFNWDVVARTGNFVFGLATGLATTTAGVPFFPLPGLATPAGNSLATRRTTDSNSLVGNFNNGVVDVNSVIDALDTEGLIRVLAEPNLSAMSGETASFLAGGEFPVPVPQDNNVITITFKKFGVGLAFTPTLVNENRINLKVAPEVSQLSNAGAINIQGFSVPALTVRRAETTVELASGQTFAIAGLLQNNSNYDIKKTPWLADIPIIGALFRSDSFRRDETELIILVTPYIVKPIAKKQVVAAARLGIESGVSPRTGKSGRAGASGSGGGAANRKNAGQPPAKGAPRRLQGPAGFTLE